MIPRLWAVTPPTGSPEVDCVDAWGDGDVGLWLRTPGEGPQAVVDRCRGVLDRARDRGVPIMLGVAKPELSAAAALVDRLGLAGIILRGDPDREALLETRVRLGERAWIGRSIHRDSGDHALCTFSVLGPIFAPTTAKGFEPVPLGLGVLARAAGDPEARIIALGGIDGSRAAACVAAGAWGLAGIRSFFGDVARIAEDVAALRVALQTAKHGPTSP